MRRGVPRGLEPDPRHEPRRRSASRTSTGQRQDSGLEGGVVAIFLERMARGDETVIFGDGGAAARLRLRRRRRRRAARGRRPQRRPVQHRHRDDDDASTSCTRAAAASRASTSSRAHEPARLGDVLPLGARPVARRARARLARRRCRSRTASPAPGPGCRRTRSGVAKSSGRCGCAAPRSDALIRPWRTATLVASLVAAVELVAARRRRAAAAREAALARGAAPRRGGRALRLAAKKPRRRHREARSQRSAVPAGSSRARTPASSS